MPAAFAAVLLLVGQLVALAHASEARHVTCQEHGEELEAAQLVEALDTCEHDHFIGVEGAGGEHEDCAIARALRTSTALASLAPALVTADSASTEPERHACELVRGRADLFRIAPKTSPPADPHA
jgi:hypothetical protein